MPATNVGRNFHQPHEGTCARPNTAAENTTRAAETTIIAREESRVIVPPTKRRHTGVGFLPRATARAASDRERNTAPRNRGMPMNIQRVTISSYTDAFASA